MRKHGWVLVLSVLIFFGLKLLNIAPRISDENYYFYTASLLLKGIFPYRDFFFQHLPGQIIAYGLLMRIVGFSLIKIRIFQLLFTLGSAFVIYKSMKLPKRGEAGLIAAGLFLFSILTLRTTDIAVGVHEATFFLLISWYLFAKRNKLAGIFLFMGLTYRIYILPAAIGFLVYEFFKGKKREVLVFLLWSLVPFFTVNGLLYALFGEKFLTPVWRYNLSKATISVNQSVFSTFIKNDLLLIVFALAGIFMLLLNIYKSKVSLRKVINKFGYVDTGLSVAFALLFQFLFLKSLSPVFPMYLMTMLPFFAVLAGLSLTILLPDRSRRAGLLLVVAIILMNVVRYQSNFSRIAVVDEFDDIVKDVVELTDPDENIFGTYTFTPLVSLVGKRKIAENEIDTNMMRHLSGLLTSERATRLATESAAVIQTGYLEEGTGRVIHIEPDFIKRSTLIQNCKLFKTYTVSKGRYNRIFLWDCGGDGK